MTDEVLCKYDLVYLSPDLGLVVLYPEKLGKSPYSIGNVESLLFYKVAVIFL